MLLVCPNPTIDHQVFLGELIPGSVVRAQDSRRLAGGKPIDVARAMKAFSLQPDITIALPQEHRDYPQLLKREGLVANLHPVSGGVRETVVLYEDGGRVTVINGKGSEISDSEWQAFAADVAVQAQSHDWVVISGSLPPTVHSEGLAELVANLKDAGHRIALDVGARWLPHALEAKPDLITPNTAEARLLVGETSGVELVDGSSDSHTLDEAASLARRLHKRGVPRVVVTAGRQGVGWATASDSGVVGSFRVDAINPIGAGDAFLGGVMAALHQGQDFPHALRKGAASAASAVMQWIPGKAAPAVIEQLLEGEPV